ncbi:MAG: ubiquitin-conjugating enzyme E2 [Candidatus Lokiarchaeota archaeon]|nr:ubiquitin-conjugating enzyme E2 [Candidatus Lokiarchaeota archaeon]
MLSDEDFYARLAEEARILELEEPGFKPVEGDLRRWRGFILGTGIYNGAVFQIEIEITRKFPFEAPRFKFLTKIFHPNIINEKICVGIFNKDWIPTMTVSGVIEAIRNLLLFPNPNSPLNRKAANLLKTDKEKYEKIVHNYVQKHATWEKLEEAK